MNPDTNEERGLSRLFSKRRPFGVDRRHLMENIKDHYTIPLAQAPVLENMDNCIDEENYREIMFKVGEGVFEIEMIGSGMDERTFFDVLPTLAGTTKGVKPGLGHYGWGMKVGMFVSENMVIENKKGDFHAAQKWWLENDGPWLDEVDPCRGLKQDAVIITHNLNKKFMKEITPAIVQKTLQEYYPTVLGGAPVLGRKIKVLLNGQVVPPPERPEYEYKKNIWADVDDERATGKVFFAKKPLPEKERGIAIIVCGRKIMRDNFGVYSKEDDKITGYLHADMLYKEVAGDKTQIRRASETWRKLSKGISRQLGDFMREIGILEEKSLDSEDMAFVNKQLAKVLADFPELNPMKFEIRKDVLIEKVAGDIPITLKEGTQPTSGGGEGPGGPNQVPVQPGEEKTVGPVEADNDRKAVSRPRKVRSGPVISEVTQPNIRKEAWFNEGEGKVYINRAATSFEKSKRWGARAIRYHVLRCAFDALLEWATQNERIKMKEYFDIRTELFLKWGGIR